MLLKYKTWFLCGLSALAVVMVGAAHYALLGVARGQFAVTALFVLLVVLIAVLWGRGAAIVASLTSGLVFNYLFVPPPNAFSVPTVGEAFLVLSLLAVAGIVGTGKERTLRIERHARQLAATEQLQKTLLDTIAHDFKTPLTAIAGSLNTLLVEAPRLQAQDQHELLETAYEQSVWLNRRVTDLLEMSRLETGVVGLRLDQVRVGELVQQAIGQVHHALAGRECRLDIPTAFPPLSGDSVLMSHALANVLENAATYSPPDAPIDVTAHAVDGHIVIAVADRGIGVPRHDLGRIFEKFYRPAREERLQHRRDGTGLGLAIARGIVEAHGGRIWAEDRAGAGIVVKLRLPVTGR